MFKKCPKCGVWLPSGRATCAGCGVPFSEAAASDSGRTAESILADLRSNYRAALRNAGPCVLCSRPGSIFCSSCENWYCETHAEDHYTRHRETEIASSDRIAAYHTQQARKQAWETFSATIFTILYFSAMVGIGLGFLYLLVRFVKWAWAD